MFAEDVCVKYVHKRLTVKEAFDIIYVLFANDIKMDPTLKCVGPL